MSPQTHKAQPPHREAHRQRRRRLRPHGTLRCSTRMVHEERPQRISTHSRHTSTPRTGTSVTNHRSGKNNRGHNPSTHGITKPIHQNLDGIFWGALPQQQGVPNAGKKRTSISGGGSGVFRIWICASPTPSHAKIQSQIPHSRVRRTKGGLGGNHHRMLERRHRIPGGREEIMDGHSTMADIVGTPRPHH